jgi:hypothetical protein
MTQSWTKFWPVTVFGRPFHAKVGPGLVYLVG